MTRTAVLGLPRIGPDRELKVAHERYWAGRSPPRSCSTSRAGCGPRLAARPRGGRRRRAVRRLQPLPRARHRLGVGAVPERCGDLDGLFALARGSARQPPLAATKWYDTNYHHLVPELVDGQRFALRPAHWLDPLAEAARLGIAARPVVLGPLRPRARAGSPPS